MTAPEWIAAARGHGYRHRLTTLERRPVWIEYPEGGPGDELDDLAPAMRRIGIDVIAAELRREARIRAS